MPKKISISFTAINIKNIVTIIVSVASVSIITRSVGLAGYGEIVALLGIASVISTVANPAIDLSNKEISRLLRSGRIPEAESALRALVVLIVSIGALVSLLIGASALTDSEINQPALLLGASMFLGTVLACLGNAYRIPGYVVEMHTTQSVLYTLYRLSYLLLLFLMLREVSASPESIGIAILASSAGYYFLMRRNSSAVLRKDLDALARADVARALDLLRKSGTPALAYLGIFLSSSTLVIFANAFDEDKQQLGTIALGATLGAVLVQLLTSYAHIAIPRIHSAIAADQSGRALNLVCRANAAITALGATFIVCSLTYTEAIISSWLAVSQTREQIGLITVVCIAQIPTVLSMQWMQYSLATQNGLKYSLAALTEGVVAAAAYLIYFKGHLAIDLRVIAALPLVLYFLKAAYLRHLFGQAENLRARETAHTAAACAVVVSSLLLVTATVAKVSIVAGLAISTTICVVYAYRLLATLRFA